MLNMLYEAAVACNGKVSVTKPKGGQYDIGIYLDKNKYWVGIYYSEPEKLRFINYCSINLEAAEKLGVGEVTKVRNASHPCWVRDEELDSEPIHFFSRSKVEQMRWLEGFLRECLKMARSIELPGQPPIPEEPEES
jgi:hypothetical protein